MLEETEPPPRLTEEEIRSFQRITGGDDLLKVIRAQGAKLPATTQSIVDQIERLNDIIAKRVAKPLGNRYNSGTITIATATTESGMKIPPPEDNYTFENVYETVFRPADITVHNEGLGNIYVLYRTSINPSSWVTTEQKIRQNESFVFPNVYELALRTDLATTQYQALEYTYAPNTVNVISAERTRTLKTVSTTHFTEAITTNNQETENITDLTSNKVYIRGVNIQSVQNLKFRLIFWSNDTFDDTDIDTDTYLDDVELDMTSSPAFRIGAANQYRLNVAGLGIIYEDLDESHEMHISIQNQSAAAKIAGALGKIQLDLFYADRI